MEPRNFLSRPTEARSVFRRRAAYTARLWCFNFVTGRAFLAGFTWDILALSMFRSDANSFRFRFWLYRQGR